MFNVFNLVGKYLRANIQLRNELKAKANELAALLEESKKSSAASAALDDRCFDEYQELSHSLDIINERISEELKESKRLSKHWLEIAKFLSEKMCSI